LTAAPVTTANHQGAPLIGGAQPSWEIPTDKIEGQLSTGLLNISFTTVTDVPIGGKITIAFPSHYLSNADNTKVNTFVYQNASAPPKATAKCTFTSSSSGVKVLGVSDATRLVCTTATAVLHGGPLIMSLIAGSITSGKPGPAGQYNVATSVDLGLVAPPSAGPVSAPTSPAKSRATIVSTSIALILAVVFVTLF
jgi:hypothetical protein